jgi:hypothetical protein
MKMEQTEGSETSVTKLHTPKNPNENIRHIKHGESLKSRVIRHNWHRCGSKGTA